MNALIIPPIANDDRLPHERAVWRTVDFPSDDRASSRQVSVDYGGGSIECTTAERVDWSRVVRWRFGWPPEPRPIRSKAWVWRRRSDDDR